MNISSLLNLIAHRGPDDRGWIEWDNDSCKPGTSDQSLSGEVLLGHVRLSIIDLSSAGWQPMISSCGRYSLVYNGEIYNYKELRVELESRGYEFLSSSDSEVLLNSIIEWQQDVFSYLRGMFSFACYDAERRRLLVARDFFGIKPLYWCNWAGGLAFASEPAVLLALPGVSTLSDPQATYDYLLLGASDHGTQSIFKDLKYFPAAHFALIDVDRSKRVDLQEYWRIDLQRRRGPSFEEATREVRRLFLESVKLHLRSDVPVGTALSGGIDSSAIVCAIRYLQPDQEIHTFSYIADDEFVSEEKWIDIVNSHTNAVSHKVRASKEELVSDLDDLIRAQGEPFSSTSIYAQYRVFKEASECNIKVMLDGQGADEILAGYIRYQGSRLASLLARWRFVQALRFLGLTVRTPHRSSMTIVMHAASEILPDWLRWWARKLASRRLPPRWISSLWVKAEAVNTKPDLVKGVHGKDKLRSRLLETLIQSSIPRLLRYEDRNSMRFSIESRVPFLHVDLVEYLFSLPEEYLISAKGDSKFVFREAMRGIVPDEILDRKDKIGFATPEKRWLSSMDIWVNDVLRGGDNISCFNMPELRKEWQRVKSAEREFTFNCWRWLNFIAWENAK